jgi:hypothetical protein
MPDRRAPRSSAGHATPDTDRRAGAERRTRLRFRELCDEVIVSKRVAQGRDLWTPGDRDEARATLSRIAPLG